MHKVFCIMGRTGSGKSTISKKVAKKNGLTILKSYTTREKRANELKESDHTHIDNAMIKYYIDKMVAYTERVGYCSFATVEQLLSSDIYVINPSGYLALKQKVKELNLDIELIPIMIETDFDVLSKRVKKGRDTKDVYAWSRNYVNESDEFNNIYQTKEIKYKINNNKSLSNSVKELISIIKNELK